MSEMACLEASTSDVKPVLDTDDDKIVKFPPFPKPEETDFDPEISAEERELYKEKFSDLNTIQTYKLHCTACDRHLGCATRNENKMRAHPLLKTLVCHTCHTFYNSGEFDKGDDGSELYCRWCGQGGQVYCCAGCPHVFCAKCIKRNLGPSKIKQIEETDDWRCFKCNSKCLWELRAICWALLRYCDLKNSITFKTEDKNLKNEYSKDCSLDLSSCCKPKKKKPEIKKKEAENLAKKSATAAVISKIPPTIQVKKFASINADESSKKPVKRSASPQLLNKVFVKTPITISSPKILTPTSINSAGKRMRITMPNTVSTNIRFSNDRRAQTYSPRIRPKVPQPPIQIISPSQFNGYSNIMYNSMGTSDNINLSLESLTQGLDMAAVVAMGQNQFEDDLVCTPDLPMEPLCEVMEDNTDDDVQCITPSQSASKTSNPPPLISRSKTLPDLSPENIVQMTENDVTVNAVTGGLKFRVDPQTLSSNKMYRLPDGRIFAINSNPNMPGGYSATIVAVAETNSGKSQSKGATYAAKLNPVLASPPKPNKNRNVNVKHQNSVKNRKVNNVVEAQKHNKRHYDLNVPVEWYRFNLIDAIDALDYSMARLMSLKQDATTLHLRSRSIDEMRNLHKTLDRLLNTSSTRFKEIRENLNKGFKQYLKKKMGTGDTERSDDDDDVEILDEETNDPIYIDENSMESNIDDISVIENQEVDLTGAGSSEHNESVDRTVDKEDEESQDKEVAEKDNSETTESNNDSVNGEENNKCNEDKEKSEQDDDHVSDKKKELADTETIEKIDSVCRIESEFDSESKIESEIDSESKMGSEIDSESKVDCDNETPEMAHTPIQKSNGGGDVNGENNEKSGEEEKSETDKVSDSKNCDGGIVTDKITEPTISANSVSKAPENKIQDTEMSDEMIENLLKDDEDQTQNLNGMKV